MLLHQMRIRKLIVFCNSDTIEDKWPQQNHDIVSCNSINFSLEWEEHAVVFQK